MATFRRAIYVHAPPLDSWEESNGFPSCVKGDAPQLSWMRCRTWMPLKRTGLKSAWKMRTTNVVPLELMDAIARWQSKWLPRRCYLYGQYCTRRLRLPISVGSPGPAAGTAISAAVAVSLPYLDATKPVRDDLTLRVVWPTRRRLFLSCSSSQYRPKSP